jgi:hypothetical protein
MKNELNTCFQQKFATGSYGVGIGRAWCSRKACEICSSLIQKKKMKKNYFSSHKLPKQQSTSFWSQGILGVNGGLDSKLQHYGPCKNSWKKSKTSHSDHSSHIEGDVMQNHEQNKKVENQDFMGKTNYFLRTLPFSPWAVSATWLHVGAP